MTDTANEVKALIFMTARDCEMYVRQSLASLSRQTLDELHVLFVDDCSKDDTGVIAAGLLSDLFPNRHTFIRNDVQLGKSRNVWGAFAATLTWPSSSPSSTATIS